MKVILSIKPKFAEKIFQGTKKYEFRRSIFKRQEIKTVLVYASSPVKKVIGEFEIDQILSENLDTLWNKTKKYSGISKEFFLQYFSDKESGYAIKIKRTILFDSPKCLKQDYNLLPPQSFSYIND